VTRSPWITEAAVGGANCDDGDAMEATDSEARCARETEERGAMDCDFGHEQLVLTMTWITSCGRERETLRNKSPEGRK
jgi:hypothetical protein